MSVRVTFMLLAMLGAVASGGCGARGGGNLSSALPQNAGGSDTGQRSGMRTYALAGEAASYALAAVGGVRASLALPSASVPPRTSLQLTSSLDAPAHAPILEGRERRLQATGTLDVYFYTTIVLSNTITFPSPPGFTIALPGTVNPAGLAFYYAISNSTPTNGASVQYRTEGPATVAGETVSFAPSSTPLTLLAGKKYIVAVYAVDANATVSGAGKIYVASFFGNTVTTYRADGTQTTPTITARVNGPLGLAVDAAGKIYVTNANNNTLTTYNPDGTQTTPTIATGLSNPSGVAVDAAGKIYVANGNINAVTTYNADGTQTTPTISAGLNYPDGVAVDATGKIYVANAVSDTVTTYDRDGSTSIPSLTDGLNSPAGIALDTAGKIYVTSYQNDTLTTYNSDGSRSSPTIATKPSAFGVAVDAAGKIYVAIANGNTVLTYDADGTSSMPTISTALNSPSGVAVH